MFLNNRHKYFKVDHSELGKPNGQYLLAGGWKIENAKELLDVSNEYYFDKDAKKLYLWPNGTSSSSSSPPSPETTLVVVTLETLINMNATKANPIKDITITGLNFRDAADITMTSPWGVPSGGDWGLYRGGAVFFEGTENCQCKIYTTHRGCAHGH